LSNLGKNWDYCLNGPSFTGVHKIKGQGFTGGAGQKIYFLLKCRVYIHRRMFTSLTIFPVFLFDVRAIQGQPVMFFIY
jgi:hypothetical protein